MLPVALGTTKKTATKSTSKESIEPLLKKPKPTIEQVLPIKPPPALPEKKPSRTKPIIDMKRSLSKIDMKVREEYLNSLFEQYKKIYKIEEACEKAMVTTN
jgi:hypothetical protein